jgi:CheY-like chemotaxis protein
VLVISRDRHFRSVTSMLLAHRGCSVTTTAKGSQVEEMIIREQADVVVIDTADSRSRAGPVASVRQLSERVGLVVVDEIPDPPREPSVIAKWGPFEDLFAAIESAARSRDASLP